METIEIKTRILKFVEHADERMLRIFNAIIEAEENELPQSHKDILDERIKFHRENPNDGKDWEEVKNSLKEQYGL